MRWWWWWWTRGSQKKESLDFCFFSPSSSSRRQAAAGRHPQCTASLSSCFQLGVGETSSDEKKKKKRREWMLIPIMTNVPPFSLSLCLSSFSTHPAFSRFAHTHTHKLKMKAAVDDNTRLPKMSANPFLGMLLLLPPRFVSSSSSRSARIGDPPPSSPSGGTNDALCGYLK